MTRAISGKKRTIAGALVITAATICMAAPNALAESPDEKMSMPNVSIEGERQTPDIFFVFPTGRGNNVSAARVRDYGPDILSALVKPWFERDSMVDPVTAHVTSDEQINLAEVLKAEPPKQEPPAAPIESMPNDRPVVSREPGIPASALSLPATREPGIPSSALSRPSSAQPQIPPSARSLPSAPPQSSSSTLAFPSSEPPQIPSSARSLPSSPPPPASSSTLVFPPSTQPQPPPSVGSLPGAPGTVDPNHDPNDGYVPPN